jgi:hypothetical protein
MRDLGVSWGAGLTAAVALWTVFHSFLFLLMLVYIEPPVNRDLWVVDVHAGLWLQTLVAVSTTLGASCRVVPAAVFFAIIDVIMTAEMDTTYVDMSRTAVTVRAMLATSLVPTLFT